MVINFKLILVLSFYTVDIFCSFFVLEKIMPDVVVHAYNPSTFERPTQKDFKFEASLYIVRPCHGKAKNSKRYY